MDMICRLYSIVSNKLMTTKNILTNIVDRYFGCMKTIKKKSGKKTEVNKKEGRSNYSYLAVSAIYYTCVNI